MRNSELGLAKCGVRTGECQGGSGTPPQRQPRARRCSKQAGEDPLGHAPDDAFLDLVGRELAGARRGCRAGRSDRCSGVEQVVERGPSARRRPRDSAWSGGRSGREKTNGRTAMGGRTGGSGHRRRRDCRGAAGARARKPTSSAVSRIAVATRSASPVLAAAAGERHVAGPGITRALGAADEQHRVRDGREHHRYGRPDEAGRPRLSTGRCAASALCQPDEPAAQWLWEWHPPPQQPPPGGGPRRLKSAGFPAGRRAGGERHQPLELAALAARDRRPWCRSGPAARTRCRRRCSGRSRWACRRLAARGRVGQGAVASASETSRALSSQSRRCSSSS